MRHSLRLSAIAVAIAFTAGTAAAQTVSIPSTPAGELLRAWVTAINSGDSVRIVNEAKAHHPKMLAPTNWLRLAQSSGGYEVEKILDSEPRHIEFVAKEKSSGAHLRGVLDAGADEPLVATSLVLRTVPPGAPVEGCKTWVTPEARSAPGAADPKDVASEEAIIGALYDVISGPACKHRDWDRFRSLFISGARLIPTGARDGRVVARAETPDEYAAAAKNGLEENGFFEHEIAFTGERFGAIGHRFSTYESRRQANDEKPFARGINSIQLLNDGTRWWIVTVYWQGERPGSPIPAQYLRQP